MQKIDIRSQVVITVVGLLVTAALVFVGISFLGMQEDLNTMIIDVTTLKTLQETSTAANAEAFTNAAIDLSEVKTDLKTDIRTLTKDIKDLWREK